MLESHEPDQVLDQENCHHDLKGQVPVELKENLIKRMNRIEGQVKGIKSMIDRDVYCDDILNQMSAVQAALHSVSRLLLESHINTCVIDRLKQDDRAVVAELLKTISKLTK